MVLSLQLLQLQQLQQLYNIPGTLSLIESGEIAVLWILFFSLVWYLMDMFYLLVGQKRVFFCFLKDPTARMRVASRSMSMGHALYTLYLSANSLIKDRDWTDENTPRQTYLIQVSLGYFLADTIYITLIERDLLFLIHHGVMILYWCAGLLSGMGGYYGALAMLFGEVTNPFQIIWDYSRKHGLTRISSVLTPIYTYFFIIVRCIIIPAISSIMYYHIVVFSPASSWLRLFWIICSVIMMVAGWVWSWMIWKGYKKWISKNKTHTTNKLH